jgi:stage II sporulation protein M
LVAIVVFGIGIAFGLATPAAITSLLSKELTALEELGGMLAPFTVSMVIFIFLKNAVVLLFSFALSPIFCLVPILTLAVNGWLVALVSSMIIEEKSLGFVLSGVLPHGIIELPALFMGEAAALSFGAMALILIIKHGWPLLTSFVRKGGIRLLLILVLFTIVGIFPTIILLALLNEQTRPIVTDNLRQNLKYLSIALALLLPAAIIETYITPLLVT